MRGKQYFEYKSIDTNTWISRCGKITYNSIFLREMFFSLVLSFLPFSFRMSIWIILLFYWRTYSFLFLPCATQISSGIAFNSWFWISPIGFLFSIKHENFSYFLFYDFFPPSDFATNIFLINIFFSFFLIKLLISLIFFCFCFNSGITHGIFKR